MMYRQDDISVFANDCNYSQRLRIQFYFGWAIRMTFLDGWEKLQATKHINQETWFVGGTGDYYPGRISQYV